MTIYISHSTGFDYKTELYEPLKNLLKEHTLIFPHENSTHPYPTKRHFQSGECDLVLAEVSYPSTGQGIELGWANILDIPIICIYKKGNKISNSLKEVTSKIIKYENIKEINLDSYALTTLK